MKGEFPDVAHRDGSFGSTEYAYATGTSQPGVPRTITLTISQKKYTKSVLKKLGFSDCKSTNTPGYGPDLSNKQPEDTVLSAEDTQTYQSIVGCLIYLTNLRYDIMYAMGQLTRAMAKPSQVHLVVAKRILRYLACLLYTSPSPRDKRQSRMPSSA